ncbi:MAG: carbonic anhydrase [Steroidobacteraceae bacterium]
MSSSAATTVAAACRRRSATNRLGLIDNWLRHVQDVRNKRRSLDELPSDAARLNRLYELNVIEPVFNVCQTTIVQNAWDR